MKVGGKFLSSGVFASPASLLKTAAANATAVFFLSLRRAQCRKRMPGTFPVPLSGWRARQYPFYEMQRTLSEPIQQLNDCYLKTGA